MNPTQLTAFRSSAQSAMETLFPATVVIAGKTYSASSSGLRRNMRQLVDGGEIEVFEITFRIFRTAFVAQGKTVSGDGQFVTWSGLKPKIESVTDDPNDPAVTLRCVQPISS